MQITIRPDAGLMYRREISAGRPPSVGFIGFEFVYAAVLDQLEGKTLPGTDQVIGGVTGHVYVLAPAGLHDHHNKPIKSKIVAVSNRYVAEVQAAATDIQRLPVSTDHQQYRMFQDQGLNTVELLAPWTDGFLAFTQKERHGDNK